MNKKTITNVGQPVTVLPGIGPTRAAHLEKMGVRTIRDLLLLRPRRYLDFRRSTQPSELKPGDNASLEGTIRVVGARRTRRRGMLLVEAALQCQAGEIVLVWFLPRRASYMPVKQGERVRVLGTVSMGQRGMQLVHPLLERGIGSETGRIIPIYPLTAGIQQNVLRRAIEAALPALAHYPDPLPAEIRIKRNLPKLAEAICWLHAPPTPDSVEGARMRLAYDESLAIAVAMSWRRRAAQNNQAPRCATDSAQISDWLAKLPYRLTAGQVEAVAAVRTDMERSLPMQRLVHGDVGSGKTTVAMYAVAKAVENGLQAAFLVPTRILAEQHYAKWRRQLELLGVQCALYMGGQSRSNVKSQTQHGRIDLVIGTHAILDLVYSQLGLVVVDEQHRFGVEQRAQLAARSHAHCLYLSATPIPRSLALAVWGDVDVTQIRQKPAGRRQIDTRWIHPEKRAEVYAFVRRLVEAGRQAYVIYPRIDTDADALDSDTLDNVGESPPLTAEAAFAYLTQGPFSGLRLGLLHGRMPVRDQDRVMSAFSQGEINILVCTTVVEVGVDVANATVMVVEQADMFGLAQLHQLRGRVGRGEHQSFCLLVAEPRTPEGHERIKVLRQTDDGFVLAEQDLALRGPGEVLGFQQSGYGELQYAQLPHDLPLLQAARADAATILQNDPQLSNSATQNLRLFLAERFPSISPVAG